MLQTRAMADAPAIGSATELVALDGMQFVRTAYATVLRREADAGGLAAYLEQLRQGVHKGVLLAAMVDSDEGRRAGSNLPGLQALVEAHRPRRQSLLRRALRKLGEALSEPMTMQLRGLRTEIALAQESLQDDMALLRARFDALPSSTAQESGNHLTRAQAAQTLLAGATSGNWSPDCADFARLLGTCMASTRS